MANLTAIGHGPVPSHSPYVPDFLIVLADDGSKKVLTREGLHPGPPAAFAAMEVGECSPSSVPDGMWPFVHLVLGRVLRVSQYAERLEWFPLATEAQSRAERARALFEETKAMSGRPEDVILSLAAASSLMSVDLEKVAREMAAVAAPGESLADAYGRSKRTR